MKITLVQGRVQSDRPANNLENIKAALKREDIGRSHLVVFPSLILSGRLTANVLNRPGIDVQYNKVWNDFLTLSKEHPAVALASSHLTWPGSGAAPVEEYFVIQAGRVLVKSASGQNPPTCQVAGQKLALCSGNTPDDSIDADVLISLGDHQYQGVPFYPPKLISHKKAWRINVGAIGGEGTKIFEGSTWVADPEGSLKGWAAGFDSTVIILDTEARNLPTVTIPSREPLDVLHQALKTGLRDFVMNAGSGKVILGLSGGMDSALVAALAVDALGPENVLGVAMPSEFNAPESLTLARDLAKNLGIAFLTVPITAIKESFTRSFLLTPKNDIKDGNLADENIQARIRGVLLMYIANREGRLVLATGNKSEAAMGYATLYGDTCGAIAPIADLYKTKVYELARHLNRTVERIPEAIITRPPSAELRPDQKDEDSLPPYAILDDILARHLEGHRSGSQVAKEGGHSPMTVAWVLSSLKKAAFKRAQSPFALTASTSPL